MNRIYEYAGCSTCRNALKWLDARGVKYEKIPIVDRPPSIAELERMLGYVGSVSKLYNTSGVVYREMKDDLKRMSDAEALRVLAKNGKLIKRPFLLTAKSGTVGFKPEVWESLF